MKPARALWPLWFLLATPLLALAQPTTCRTPDDVTAAETRANTAMDEMRAEQKRQEARVAALLQSRGEVAGWSPQKQADVLAGIGTTPEFAAFEKEKKPYSDEMMGVIRTASQKTNPAPQETCDDFDRIARAAEKIKDVNTRQYGFVAEQVKAAR